MTKPAGLLSRSAFAVSIAMGLASCGNDPNNVPAGQILKNTVTSLFNRESAEPAPLNAQQIQAALDARPESIAVVQVESRKASAMMLQIGQNGPYKTYATSQKQTVVMRNGVVTATRGLGGDLMSSELGGATDAISGTRAGGVTRTMRFLDGEDKEFALRFRCQITPGDGGRMTLGEVDTEVTSVAESCNGGGQTFSNIYYVGQSGNVVGSRQWLGSVTGYVTIQLARE